MSKKQIILSLIFASIFGGLIALAGFSYFVKSNKSFESFEEKQRVSFTNWLTDSSFTVPEGLNFVYAAEQVTPAVVHIRSSFVSDESAYSNPMEEFLREFYGEAPSSRGRRSPRQGQGFGSGVIISQDGYIVTNNHVIDNANDMQVTLANGHRYSANLIGTDPTTDLALIKVDASNLPFVKFGNSDVLRVGEWVLAVGNPFAQGTPSDLTSTVTAGIVSAKGRSIGILQDQLRVEAFIQTDAVVNPGNSGGALVNLKGELIGINTAIASPTGVYSGYSFAVPVSLVRKVMDDLLEYGTVQRALLGVGIADIRAELAEEKGLQEFSGVYIQGVNEGSAAEEAGIEAGDVITSIDNQPVKTTSRLQEIVAQKRPGDKVQLTYLRDGKDKTATVTLRGTEGNTKIVKTENSISLQGATFENVSNVEMNKHKISGGVKVTSVKPGKWRDAGIKEGFIITAIDKVQVKNVNDLTRALNNKQGGVLIEGVNPNGEKAFIGMGW